MDPKFLNGSDQKDDPNCNPYLAWEKAIFEKAKETNYSITNGDKDLFEQKLTSSMCSVADFVEATTKLSTMIPILESMYADPEERKRETAAYSDAVTEARSILSDSVKYLDLIGNELGVGPITNGQATLEDFAHDMYFSITAMKITNNKYFSKN